MTQWAIQCVVPTLNSAKTLDTTLLSLRSQRDVQVQVTVADSGSTDSTLDICKHWDVPTIYVPRGNMYRAVNAGLRGCPERETGTLHLVPAQASTHEIREPAPVSRQPLSSSSCEWITYLNSDDWLYPDAYARLIARATEENADLIYGNCDYTDADGRFAYSFQAASPAALPRLFSLGLQGFAQPAAIFRRRLYDQLHGFDENYRFSGDAHFFARATLTGAPIAVLPGPPVACFRLHAQQFTQTKKVEIAQEDLQVRRLFESAAKGPAWLTRTRWRLANAPHYAIRILRETAMAHRLRLPRSVDAYSHC